MEGPMPLVPGRLHTMRSRASSMGSEGDVAGLLHLLEGVMPLAKAPQAPQQASSTRKRAAPTDKGGHQSRRHHEIVQVPRMPGESDTNSDVHQAAQSTEPDHVASRKRQRTSDANTQV